MAHELSRLTGIPYFKNKHEWQVPDLRDDEGYFIDVMRYGDLGMLSQFLMQTGTSVILDRSWPSEKVYSHVFGRETDEEALRRLDQIYHEMGAKILIPLRKDYSQVDDRFDSITEEMLLQLHEAYLEFSRWTSCDNLVFFVDNEDLEEEMGVVLPFVKGG